MAIVNVLPPEANTVATRPVVWQFESDSVTIVRLILEVLDVDSNIISTIEQNPEPGTTGVFKFNISSILSDQLSFTTANSSATGGIASTISQETAFLNYTVAVYEVQENGTTGYPNAADYNSTPFVSHNYVLTHKEWTAPFLLSEYDMESGTGKKFLTNSSATKYITKGYSEYLAMHRVQNDSVFVRDYYDINDTFLFSQRYPVVNKAGFVEYDNQYGKISGAGLPGSGTEESVNDEYFYNIPIDAANWELVDAGNGFAYAAPGRSGTFLKLNLATNAVQTFGSFTAGTTTQYTLGILNPNNGKIYFFSDDNGPLDVLVLDPSNDTYTTFGVLVAAKTPRNLTITPLGIIYATTGTAQNFLKIDTVLETITTIMIAGAAGGGTADYSSNGFVYFVATAGEFYKLDVSDDSTSTVVDPLLLDRFLDSYIDNGVIYGISNTIGISASVVKIDTLNTDTITSTLITNTNVNGMRNISRLADGNSYLFNSIDGIVYKFNTVTNAVTNIGTLSVTGGGTYSQPTTTINGFIYALPLYITDEILKLDITPGDQIEGVVGAYCLVYIENSDLSVASEVKKYVFEDACGENIQIHWENKFSAQDSYTIKGRIVRGFSHKGENYLKPNGNVITSTSRGMAALSNTVEHTFKVYSKSIKLSDINWIQEMFYNKRAWTEEDGHLLPIILENGNVTESDTENGIYQFSFDFSYANFTDGSRG